MSSSAEANLTARAQLFKALGNPTRLLILNLIKSQPRHGEELALILMLNPATVSHHLTLLAEAGLVQAEKEQYYQVYSLAKEPMQKTIGEMIFLPHSGIAENVEEDAFRQKVLRTFLRRGRLTGIPAQRKKRQVILEKIAAQFEPQVAYPEREVNIILLDYHDDVASLRRGLIEFGLLERTPEGVYTRVV